MRSYENSKGWRKKEQKYEIKGQTATNTHYFALPISWNSFDLR
jgi:hypothetical protein